jgi:Skp family chaperone for outer membrane proteins
MKKYLCSGAFGIVLMFFWSLNLSAAPNAAAQGPKIGYVDFEAAFRKEEEAQKYVKELEDEERKIFEDEQKARIDIEAEMAKLQASMLKLEKAAQQKQQNAFSDKVTKLQQEFTEKRTTLEKMKQSKQRELQEKNQFLIGSIAREGGYALIINIATLAYLSDESKQHDITDKLVLKYNQAYPAKKEPPKKPQGKSPSKNVGK